MITLSIKNIEQRISLSPDKFFNIIIESPVHMRNFVLSLQEHIAEGNDFILAYDDKNDDLKLSKATKLIENPLFIDVDDKKTNTNIQKDLSQHISYDKKEKFELLKRSIGEYINEIAYDYFLPLKFDEEMNLNSFLKSISLSYSEDLESLLEKVLNQLKILSFVFGYKLFFFINFHDYFANEELELLFSQLNLLEISFVLVSSHVPKHKIDKEFLIVIDEDLCELHIE